MQLSDRIGRRMKLQDLHVLMTVVQAGSMRKAAALLNTSQPAISRSIADLEDAIGVRLLDRTPHGVEPTEYGRALLDGGAAMFDELRLAVKNIEFLADPTVGETYIGCSSPAAIVIVATVIRRLSSRYPQMSFHIVEGDIGVLQQELSGRRIELAIGLGPVSDEKMKSETLYLDRLLVVAGSRNKWSRQKQVRLADLIKEPWLLPTGTGMARLIADAFCASGVPPPRATVSARSPRLTDILVASGHFLTVFPE